MTAIKDERKIETILKNINAVKDGLNLEYSKEGTMMDLAYIDDSFHILHKCTIKNEHLEVWVIMINGKGTNTLYTSKDSAEYFLDRYCGTSDSCRIVKLTEN